jgi:hypothetical protein
MRLFVSHISVFLDKVVDVTRQLPFYITLEAARAITIAFWAATVSVSCIFIDINAHFNVLSGKEAHIPVCRKIDIALGIRVLNRKLSVLDFLGGSFKVYLKYRKKGLQMLLEIFLSNRNVAYLG